MKISILSQLAECMDLALKLQDEGNEVVFHTLTEGESTVGLGLLPIKKMVDDLDADLIINDDVFLGSTSDRLRRLGKLVIGGSVITDRLENDREFGRKIMHACQIKVPRSETFTDFNSGKEFIVANPDKRYVFKPHGQKDREFTYIAKGTDDMVAMMEHFASKWQGEEIVFEIQEFIDGIEMAMGGWFNGSKFCKPILPNFEHKRLMNGDIGPNCYDEQTEVLTLNGWKYFKDIAQEDKIASLENNSLVYRKPSQIVVSDFSGKMVKLESKCLDLLVTLGHNMYVKPRNSRQYGFFSAGEENRIIRATIPLVSNWVGNNDFNITPDDAKFLGVFLSEGCTTTRDRIVITSKRDKEFIETILSNLNLKFYKHTQSNNVSTYEIHDDHWFGILKPLGKSDEKYIPELYKALPKELLLTLYEAMFRGDGSIHKITGQRTYYTVSKKLANDLQEILLKMGVASRIRSRDRREEISYNGKYIRQAKSISYEVVEKSRTTAVVRERHYSTIQYDGKVYCVTVPSHIIYVRRNGKACWCGQTGEMGTVMAYRTHNRLYQETLAKTETFLKTTGYRGFIDIACIVNKDDAYGLEWTSRFGYPTLQIQDEVHKKGSWTSFLYNLANGSINEVPADTSKWDVGVAYCALPWPLHDYSDRFQGTPVFFPENKEHIHLRDCWLDGKQYRQTGLMGYICVCTGSDISLRIAKEKAYKIVNSVYIPGGFYRTDIADSVLENLPILKSWNWLK